MLTVALTFDYELFFGTNNGSYEDILFYPSERLISLLYNEGISATFFVDTCSVVQMGKYGEYGYVERFTKQIADMAAMNQDVQLHIHPHWMRSEYIENQWKFDNTSYRIHEFGFSKKRISANTIISQGIEYLNESIKTVRNDYECISYRAGGFCLQPHKELIKVLYLNGIRVDSSIAPHLKAEDSTHAYDYCKDDLKCNWYISPEKEWWEDGKDASIKLFEVPIATVNKNPIMFVANRILHPDDIKLRLGGKRGTYISSKKNKNSRINTIWNYISGYNAISMDAYKSTYVMQALHHYYYQNKCDSKDAFIALIGHPKLVTDNYLFNLRNLIDSIRNDYKINIMSISEIWNRRNLDA